MIRKTWTLADAPPLDGRLALVTGSTGGLGYETALGLAKLRASVILSGRNAAKGAAALARIRQALPGATVRFEPLDLASLASIAAFARNLVDGPDALDILVNNAGVMSLAHRQSTADGFEMQFGTNYLGHFALTARLLPALVRSRPQARVVSLASLAHRQGRIAFDDLQSERRYDPWAAYRQSKLAMLIFARELQRRSVEFRWPIRSIAAHPGWAVTDIIDNGPAGGQNTLKTMAMKLAFRLLGQSAAAGTLPILFAAAAPEADAGGYYGPAGRGELRGPVAPSVVMPQASDPHTGQRLWDISERLTGTSFETRPV